MNVQGPSYRVLLVDDDPDDLHIAEAALTEGGVSELHSVASSTELFDYLLHRGTYSADGSAPRPHLILLDLRMPGEDGLEVLRTIKTDPAFRRIPVIVMTNDSGGSQIERCYELGASGYVTKRRSIDEWADVMKTIAEYWFRTVVLPAA